MARCGVVLGGQPVVVPVVVRLRLAWVVELSVQVPLADMRGGVARVSEQPGEGDLARAQVDLAVLGDPGIDAVAVRSASGEDGRSRR